MEIRVLSSGEIMRAIVDRIGCKLNEFNADGVYRRDNPEREHDHVERILELLLD